MKKKVMYTQLELLEDLDDEYEDAPPEIAEAIRESCEVNGIILKEIEEESK